LNQGVFVFLSIFVPYNEKINLDTIKDHHDSPKEEEFISALKRGDRKSFEHLFNIYRKRLYYFCYSLLNNKEVAEGITQIVFIKIWVNKESIDETKSFSGFLYTIAKNQVLNHIRKSVHQQKFINYLIVNPKELNQTEEDVSYNELKLAFDNRVELLPTKRKQIYLLSKVQGLSRLEIARQLNLSINTVDSQLSKAIKFIRSGLKNFLPLFLFMLFHS